MGKQFDIPIADLSALDAEPTSASYACTKETGLPPPSNAKTVLQLPVLAVCLTGTDLDLFWQSLP